MAARAFSLVLGADAHRLSDVYGDGTGIVNATHDLPYRQILLSAADVDLVVGPISGGDYAAAVLADGPVAYWRMGEAAGNLADATGHGWTATVVGAPTYGQAGATVDGNDAIDFDATDDAFTTLLDQDDIPNTGWTIEAWFKGGPLAASRAIVSRNNVRPELLIEAGGSGRILTTDAGAVQVSVTGPLVNDGVVFHHLVATYDGAILRLFTDGAQFPNDPQKAANPYNPTVATWRIGALGAGVQPTDGTIDEIALYDYPLSAARIRAHFELGASGLGLRLPAGAAPLSMGPFNTGPLKLSDLYVAGSGGTLHILAIPF